MISCFMILTRVIVKFFYPSYLQTANVLYAFYCHNGSFSQPEGKPRAALSTSGNVAKSLFILSSISLFGDIMSRKYLMMHISKYTIKGSVGKVIQGRDILIGMVVVQFIFYKTYRAIELGRI